MRTRPGRLLVALAVLAAVVWALAAQHSGNKRGAPGAKPPGGARIKQRFPAPVKGPPLRSLRGAPMRVAIDVHPTRERVPRDFLGLSFEVGDLPRIARLSHHGDLVNLLRSLGAGSLRFGGVSVDEAAAWAPDGRRPRWARTGISAADLAGIGRLARRTGWSVLLTVTLGHPDARTAAQEAAAARAALGPSLIGIELGNEPDAYVSRRLRPPGWSFPRYQGQIAAYKTAIRSAAPGLPIAGPDASSGVPPLPWVASEARLERPALLTDHYYPSSSCGYHPPLGDLLSPVTRTAETKMLTRLRAISRSSGIPLRVGETNNISCGGQPGVSNTFASALWAVDYVTRTMAAGLAGLNLHDLIGRAASYSPLAAFNAGALSRGALHALPEWYALLLTRQLPGERLLRAHVSGSRQLSVTAFRGSGGRLQVVLDDFDAPGGGPLLIRLRVPSRYGDGTILRLTAPSPSAVSDVRLGGRRVATNGDWRPPVHPPGVSGRRGALAVTMPPSSAALVTLYPRP